MIQSLGDLVRRNGRFFPDDPCLVFEGRVTTNAQLLARARRLAAALAGLGCQRQDRVAILGMNSDRYLEIMAGCWLSGLIVSTVNFRLAGPEYQFILSDTKPRVLLFEAGYGAVIAALRDRLEIEHYVCIDGEGFDWATPYQALLDQPPDGIGGADVRPEELATLIYTSGTTGRPKGVMRSHGAELSLGEQIAVMFDVRTGGRSLVVMPLFHAGAQASVYAQLWRSGILFIQRGFDPAAVLDAVERERLTNLHFVPQMLQSLLEVIEQRSVDTSSVETIAYAAAPMSPALLRRALGRFGAVFVNGWGMSEGNGTCLPKHKHRLDGPDAALLASIGQPHPKASIRIVDDAGADCGPSVPGELWLRSPSVMTGYWNNSAATIEAMRDGWLRTGDIGYADAAGNIFLVDRKKDMIISGGENIYSQEVERAIAEHPGVASVAVIGIPDETWGESVMAIVVPRAGVDLTAESVVAHSVKLLASYKKPRHVVLAEALPMLQSGKTDKIALRRQYAGLGKAQS